MKNSTRFLAPAAAVVIIVLAVQWSVASRADAVGPDAGASEPEVSETAFEYFPAQFDVNAAEAGEDIPTF